ncbi:MAG: Ig-like domain-containing protein [Armatimonadota bacterium]
MKRLVVLLLFLFALARSPAEQEAVRFRLALLPGGTVSVSTDGGERYTVIGRITALPSRLTTGYHPPATAVLQSDTAWFIQHNEREAVQLVPSGTKDVAALVTDAPKDSLLFSPLLRDCTARLMLQEGRVAYSLPPGYRYKVGDVWVIQITAKDETQQAEIVQFVNERLGTEAQQAVQRSVARARREKLPVVNGTLNLEVTAKYAEQVKFVFFAVDGMLLGTSNVLPTVFRWDSTQVPDGEYVIEARAVDSDQRDLALVRKRVLVRNGKE